MGHFGQKIADFLARWEQGGLRLGQCRCGMQLAAWPCFVCLFLFGGEHVHVGVTASGVVW